MLNWKFILAVLILTLTASWMLPNSSESKNKSKSLIKAISREEQAQRSEAIKKTGEQSKLPGLEYQPRKPFDESGYAVVMSLIPPWRPNSSLEDIRQQFANALNSGMAETKAALADSRLPIHIRIETEIEYARLLNYIGNPNAAYQVMAESRERVLTKPAFAEAYLSYVIFFQGVSALRKGENENCILCRGDSSCILPLSSNAVHKNPKGSRLAVEHFTEYLDLFPNDLEAKWLLNVAHMTLGEHPDKVDPRYLVKLDAFTQDTENSIGKFKDIGHLVGLNRLNQAGGAIMDDFDNDGLFDVFVSTFDPSESSVLFRNEGNGKFKDLSKTSGFSNDLSGLNCVQTDFDNDGNLDVLVIRGAWLSSTHATRPSLYRNNGDLTFTDVTVEAGMDQRINSIAAAWGDYDNDGWLDCFVCGEQQASLLYHNQKDGTFKEVALATGMVESKIHGAKGANWLDVDNDGYQDLFINRLNPGGAVLYRNLHDGTFEDVTAEFGINGPMYGFSSWTWDYDNDGYLDLFATCYDRTLAEVVKGIMGQSHTRQTCRLFHNESGAGFRDMTKEAGLDGCYSTMGSNFGDLDNDGDLDMYLGTGEPNLATLIPNRMFVNLDGKRFAEVTSSSGTGSLQKGHGVAMGDWDRNGNLDLFVEMGGAIDGDQFHNILFQNPGNSNASISVKLIGDRTNRPAVGARIKVVTKGAKPQSIYRVISSGSSFGANPFEQTIGLGQATGVETLEVEWPTSGTKQVFHDIEIGSRLEIREFEKSPRTLPQLTIKL